MPFEKVGKMKDESDMNSVKHIYIMETVYCVGGGPALYCRIIEYLMKYTNIKISIIDFSDGILSRTLKTYFPNKGIEYINYAEQLWNIEDDAVIFTSADRIGCIKPHTGKNVKIGLILWENGIDWPTLFEKKLIPDIGILLNKHNALNFTDFGCYISGCRQLQQKFEKSYLPIFYQNPDFQPYAKKTAEDEINLVWLGRLSEAKEQSIYNIAENFNKYSTKKKRIFHIIGNGTAEDRIKNTLKKYENSIKCIFTGILTGNELFRYLQENTDVGVAMGTSLLNFAALGLPVIAAHEHPKPFFTNEFCWIFDLYEYCMGSPVIKDEASLPMFQKISVFDKMLDDVCLFGKGNEIGEKCRKYYEKTHTDIERVGKAFLYCINRTTLTCEALKKTIKYMPYDDANGLAVQTIRFLGIPVIKIYHHSNKRRIYFCGMRIVKIIVLPGKTKYYILGVKMFENSFWGRYSFPAVTSDSVKEECKNKYVISERLFKD